MKQFLILLTYSAFSLCYSQNHQLIDTLDYEKHKSLLTKFEEKNKSFNKQLKAKYKGKLRKEILGTYIIYQNQLQEILENKKLLFENSFQNYVNRVFDTLVKNNPSIKDKNIRLFLTKNTEPNALSIGNGTILINIGLFSVFENEHQLLSVIAHEVAHEILKHSNKSILRKANLNISVLGKNSNFSKSIKYNKYKRGSQSFNLLKDLLYENGEKQRFNETEADSLGFVLYKNTSAPKKEFINALSILKKYDSVPAIVLDSSIYIKTFSIPEQPFNSIWMKNEDFNNYNYDFYKEKIELDSLKAHPEMEKRIEKLKYNFPELSSGIHYNLSVDTTFIKLKYIANKAFVENLFYANEYGLSIYLILKRLESNPNNNYYKKWLGINFNAIYEAKKKYQLNRYVDRVVPKKQCNSYKAFLNFIWNLNLKEIKTIADYYEGSNLN